MERESGLRTGSSVMAGARWPQNSGEWLPCRALVPRKQSSRLPLFGVH